jgi:hypothetical protein
MYTGPSIIRNGLILAVDATNIKSYPGSGTTWNDLSGNSRNGTINNSPTYSISPISSFDFTTNPTGNISTGINQNITFPNTTIPTSGSFSVEAWINRDSSFVALTDRESIFTNTGTADGFRIQISQSPFPGTIYYLIGGIGSVGYSEGNIGTGYSIADGKWHQIAIVFDRAAQLGSYLVYAYVDGALKGSVAISTGNEAFTAASPGVSLGCCSKYKGKISKITTYNRALSATEILQNYNATKARFGL